MFSMKSIDKLLSSEVVAVCNELGHKNNVNNKYVLNRSESSNCIRDLIRFLRNDDNRFLVRTQMGLSNVVNNDLIPIVEEYSLEDNSLFDKVLRLLVDITNPTLLHFKQRIPSDKMEFQKFLELQSFLFSYKLSFGCHQRFWTVLAKHLTKILELDEEKRQIEDGLMLERILILIRNILHIPIDCDSVKVTEDDTNPHDRILQVMHSSGINDLILFLCNHSEHQEFCFHLIEIISLMFREQNAEFIALSVANDQQNNGSNSDRRSLYEREQDRKELKLLRAKDQTNMKLSQSCYNRFNGATFHVKNMKSISDRDLIYHKIPADLSQITFDANKAVKRKPKNRKPMAENSSNSTSSGAQVIHRSTFRVRKLLYDFCVDFLNNSYNQFMRLIRDNLRRNLSQDNDDTYYLWALQFFMEFNRCNPKTNDNALVDETMSVSSFHYLHTQIEHYLDLMKTQKEDITLWSKRLHFGLRAYRELLFTLGYLDSINDQKVRKMAQLIKTDIFYEVEYRDLLLHLLHDYNEVKMSKAFLKDLIETNHIFLKMLEIYSKKSSRLMIREKLKQKKKRKVSKKKTQKDKTPPEEIWIEIVSTVSETLQGNIDLPSPEQDVRVRAFDSTSEKTTDEQKMEILRRVHDFLEQKLVKEAIALYRDARNVWSGDEDNAFGAQDILPEEELLSLNEVLMTEFPNESPNDEEILSEEETETVESTPRVREREFVLTEAIQKYCHPSVVKNYALLLKTYDTNSSETNHCIVRMLHRIGWDSKMHCMLFQASIFRTFQRILRDPLADSPTIQELSKFAKFIIAKFLNVAQKNKKVFMEILFWKNCREAFEIEEGYDQNANSKVNTKQLWTEEQELELNVLFEEYKDKVEKDKDVVDLILEHMIDETKTRRQLIIQLKRQGLYTQIKPLKKRRKSFKSSDIIDNSEIISEESSDEENIKESVHDNEDNVVVNQFEESSNSSDVLKIDEMIKAGNDLIEKMDLNTEEEKSKEINDVIINDELSNSSHKSNDTNVLGNTDIEINNETNDNVVNNDSDSDEEIIGSFKRHKRLIIDEEEEEEEETVDIPKKKRRVIMIDDDDDD